MWEDVICELNLTRELLLVRFWTSNFQRISLISDTIKSQTIGCIFCVIEFEEAKLVFWIVQHWGDRSDILVLGEAFCLELAVEEVNYFFFVLIQRQIADVYHLEVFHLLQLVEGKRWDGGIRKRRSDSRKRWVGPSWSTCNTFQYLIERNIRIDWRADGDSHWPTQNGRSERLRWGRWRIRVWRHVPKWGLCRSSFAGGRWRRTRPITFRWGRFTFVVAFRVTRGSVSISPITVTVSISITVSIPISVSVTVSISISISFSISVSISVSVSATSFWPEFFYFDSYIEFVLKLDINSQKCPIIQFKRIKINIVVKVSRFEPKKFCCSKYRFNILKFDYLRSLFGLLLLEPLFWYSGSIPWNGNEKNNFATKKK